MTMTDWFPVPEEKAILPGGEDYLTVVALMMPVMLCGFFYYKEKMKNPGTEDVKEEKKNIDLLFVAKKEEEK